jgi:hypothetical protein
MGERLAEDSLLVPLTIHFSLITSHFPLKNNRLALGHDEKFVLDAVSAGTRA